jgi:hypothetical protein
MESVPTKTVAEISFSVKRIVAITDDCRSGYITKLRAGVNRARVADGYKPFSEEAFSDLLEGFRIWDLGLLYGACAERGDFGATFWVKMRRIRGVDK